MSQPMATYRLACLPPDTADSEGNLLPWWAFPFEHEVSDREVDLIRPLEPFYRFAGHDGLGRSVIGYGYKKHVEPGAQWTPNHAKRVLRSDLEEVNEVMRRTIGVPLRAGMHLAILDWVFDCGEQDWIASFALKALNEGDYGGCITRMRSYGASLRGHVRGWTRRRDLESHWWHNL